MIGGGREGGAATTVEGGRRAVKRVGKDFFKIYNIYPYSLV